MQWLKTTLLALSCASGMALAAPTQTLPSGVIINHTKLGTGAQPTADSTVTVHYEGRLDNGKVFDSSYQRGESISFPLQNVVPCWTEGLQTMKVGGSAELTCPSATAYGQRGVPGVIPGGATLKFKVELLGVR
jgi:FKBP-type peptidyl-prolyl cis-trans isomerase FkpA